MLLKSIKLHNIRSYEDEEITFPDGSVLLSGDIGSGKSTILLAVEFAIFGAKKGELPAYTLLRHGKKEGFVELKMEIDGKNILVKRTLKKSKNDIKQDAGYVITNGMKKDATSEELRAILLGFLGYPKDLVKKGKDLIYRYTVYTPQEEMKQILYEGSETRLDTLRKVFNIDKYKRIKDNSRIIISSLKERKRHLEGFISDLEYKKKELEERKKEIASLDERISGILPKLGDIMKAINEKKSQISLVEKEMNELNILKKELGLSEAGITHKIEQNNRLNLEIKNLKSQIEAIKKELDGRTADDSKAIAEKIDEKEKELREAEVNYESAIKKIKGIEVNLDNSAETIKKVSSLDICPVCEQKVDENHKHGISDREGKKHEKFLESLKILKENQENTENARQMLRKELDGLVRKQHHSNVIKVRVQNLKEKQGMAEEKSALKDKIKKEIGILNAKKIELKPRIERFARSEERYKSVKKELDELLPQEKFLEVEKGKCESAIDSIKKFMARMNKEIDEKEKAKEGLNKTGQIVNWMDEMFTNLMSNMEKHVMVSIHHQFNELFRKWFDVIMEDESLNVRVDEEFTPLIEQDGYETYIENLSGGEKTSVALSYRLALNKVVNDIVAGIKTKDIIMLDEPTDGFSTEQLDKVRDVLQQLNMRQAIIVSHESKIEGFVQNVIRVEKRDNVSVVV